jgi:hypothetical protein
MSPNVGLGTQGLVERGWGLWLTSVLGVVIAGIFVGARLAQRSVKRSGLGVDDWMIIAALISSVLLTVTECQGMCVHAVSGPFINFGQLLYMAMGGIGTHCPPTLASLLASGSMEQTVSIIFNQSCHEQQNILPEVSIRPITKYAKKPEFAIHYTRTWLIVTVVYKVVLMFNKISVVCLYYRIFAITTKWFRIACHIMSKCVHVYLM